MYSSLSKNIIRIRQAFYTAAVENTQDMIVFLRPTGDIIGANRAAAEGYGFSLQELCGLNIRELQLTQDELLPFGKTETCQNVAPLRFETFHRRKGGRVFPVEISFHGSKIASRMVFVLIVRDITERKQMENQLRHQATHDALTDIPNRYLFEQALWRAVGMAERGIKSALLFIDIDNFKLVNDSFGHIAGDQMLISLVKALRKRLRRNDLLARLGGDEFAVLLEETTEGEALNVAEKLRQVVESKELCQEVFGAQCDVSASIGVVVIDGSLSSGELLLCVDEALYAAKDSGKNKVISVESSLVNRKADREKTVAGLVRDSLEGKPGLVLHFQPVMTADMNLLHYEALVRMRNQDGSLKLPGEFLSAAAKYGSITRIDRWVIDKAIEVIKKMGQIPVFMNLSAESLNDNELLGYLSAKLRAERENSLQLGFEISETLVNRNLMRIEQWTQVLRPLGCRFVLDDMQAAFSQASYSYILPFDYLKVSGAFIRSLEEKPQELVLLDAINRIAHSLGKKTIAGFVENSRILEYIRSVSVDCVQGYHIGIPLEEEQLRNC